MWRLGKGQTKDKKLQDSCVGWEIFRHSQELLCVPRRESEQIGLGIQILKEACEAWDAL